MTNPIDAERLSDLAFLKDESRLEGFVNYYNERAIIEKEDEITTLDLLRLIDVHLKTEPQFGLPRIVKINKMASQKPREVFIFPTNEQLLLKYINYALGDLDLEIHHNCFSFQRGCSVIDAVKYLKSKDTSPFVCIKIDISNYFNSISTEDIKTWLPKSVTSMRYLTDVIVHLLSRETVWVDGSLRQIAKRGVMAGMPLSPTLSNLYLRDFDEEMANQFPVYARYSDDMIFFCASEQVAEKKELIKSALIKKGLQINANKSKVFLAGQGFEFLGLFIQGARVDLSPATVEKIKGKIKRKVRSLYRWQVKKDVDPEKTLMVMNRKFNRKFFGMGAPDSDFTWAKYYFGVLTETDGLRKIDHYYQESVRYLATGRYCKLNYKKMPYAILKTYGYLPLVSEYYKCYNAKIKQTQNS